MANAYTYRKYMGDDVYSYAVFKMGRPILTGLSRSSAQYECKRLNPPQPDVRATRTSSMGRVSTYVIEDHSTSSWFGSRIGYAVGARGEWEVFDGVYLSKAKRPKKKPYNSMFGRPLGTAKTIKEACDMAAANAKKKGK